MSNLFIERNFSFTMRNNRYIYIITNILICILISHTANLLLKFDEIIGLPLSESDEWMGFVSWFLTLALVEGPITGLPLDELGLSCIRRTFLFGGSGSLSSLLILTFYISKLDEISNKLYNQLFNKFTGRENRYT